MKEEKVSVTSGKKKASVCKETVAVSATIPKIVRKNQNTLPPHLPSQPFHEVEVCRRREVSEAKVTMGPFFDIRVDIILKGTCTRTPCEYWHPPECQLFKNTYLFPHYKVDEQPNGRRKATSQKEEKVKTKALSIAKSVSQLSCVSQDSDALGSQGTKEFR